MFGKKGPKNAPKETPSDIPLAPTTPPPIYTNDQQQPLPQQQQSETYKQEQDNREQPHQHQPFPQYMTNANGPPPNQQYQPAGYQQYQTSVPLANLQSQSAPVDCPACRSRANTVTDFQSGNTTNAWAAGLFLFTCCCCIPYMVDSTKDVVHKCGNCGANLAVWHRSGRTEVIMHG